MDDEQCGQKWRSPRWFIYIALLLLAVGIGFRAGNLDGKVYWVDEAYTSLRMSGYTKAEFVQAVYTGQPIDVAALQRYQYPQPDRGWDDTLHALKGNAEHPPLYFLLVRLWVQGFGDSIAVIRSLSVLFGVLVFPSLFWLCWELFQQPIVAWGAIALVAISSFHVLYAQEARPYSLWTLMVLWSSANLLWAMRTRNKISWVLYGLTVSLGLYTQLLFGIVAIAHGIYVGIVEEVIPKRRLSQTVVCYLLATGAGVLTFIPWAIVIFHHRERVQAVTASLTEAKSLSVIINEWCKNLGRGIIGADLASANGLLLLPTAYALYYLYRYAPRRAWLFLLILTGVCFLALALPDLLWGGRRSLRLRYLIPAYLGVQLALAYLFTTQIVRASANSTNQQPSTNGQPTALAECLNGGSTKWRLGPKLWRMAFILFCIVSLTICGASVHAQVSWNKDISRSSYYPLVASFINQTPNPLLISDAGASDILAFSHQLAAHVTLELVDTPAQVTIPHDFTPVMLLNPSQRLRNWFSRRGYWLGLIYRDPKADPGEEDRLWLVQKR
jgi:uncharacterized membrane protein